MVKDVRLDVPAVFGAFQEQHFHARGIATLSMDGPGQGEGREHGHLRADFGPAYTAMVAAIADRPGLNGQRGLVGMAFGGHLALRIAGGIAGLAGVVVNHSATDDVHAARVLFIVFAALACVAVIAAWRATRRDRPSAIRGGISYLKTGVEK